MQTNLNSLENFSIINGVREITEPENKLTESLESLLKSVNNGKIFNDEDYSELLDISKMAKLQRTLKWAGLKPVS